MHMTCMAGRLLTLGALLVAGGCNRDCPPSGEASPPAKTEAPAAINPVQHEMRLLENAMHAMLSGIARGDVRAAPAAFADVDRAKQATEAALESGRYVPARNADQLAAFRELDEAFHGDLERMLAAAARNDVPATAEAFGSVMRRCQPCHAAFRK